LLIAALGVHTVGWAQSQPARAAPPAPPVAEAPLTESELALAERVYVGAKRCELGRSVQVQAAADAPGHFHVTLGTQNYRMRPVPTATGALRLEDRAQGAVWLQLANKSMLMSQRSGRRLADECANDTQRAAAQARRLNPGPGLFDVAKNVSP
jgi:hypothetical protein